MRAREEREIVWDGIRYTARVRGPAPWSRGRRRWWQFWRIRDDMVLDLSADVIEFSGHPTPTRSRVESAIPRGSLHTLPEDDLVKVLRRALGSATRPGGNDLVALTRGDEQLVIAWGDWNVLGALLYAGGYELRGGHGRPAVSEQEANALRTLISTLWASGTAPQRLLPPNLPEGLTAFLEGGAFDLIDSAAKKLAPRRSPDYYVNVPAAAFRERLAASPDDIVTCAFARP